MRPQRYPYVGKKAPKGAIFLVDVINKYFYEVLTTSDKKDPETIKAVTGLMKFYTDHF